MHWRVDADEVRELLPDQLALDTHEGDAWIGVTPFCITGLRLRGLPPVPGVSTFLEVNARTYVVHEGKPGIWFFSLDAESRFAVEAARLVYRLPYHHARMSAARRGEWIDYRSSRVGAALDVSYRPVGPVAEAGQGTLEHFLTERYCLYTEHARRAPRRADPPRPVAAPGGGGRGAREHAGAGRARRRAAAPLLGAAGRRDLAARAA